MAIQFEGEAALRKRMSELEKRRRAQAIAEAEERASKRKILTSIRLDPIVHDYYKSHGPGWQGRINQVLRDAIPKKG